MPGTNTTRTSSMPCVAMASFTPCPMYYSSTLGPVNREIHQKLLKRYLKDDAEVEALDQWYTKLTEVVFSDRNIELQNKLNEICDQYMKDLLSAEACARQMQGIADIYLNE